MDQERDAGLRKDKRALRKGCVIDASGEPVAGALVSVVWGTAPTPDIGRRTNSDGLFQIALPPGQYRITAVTTDAEGEVEVDGESGADIVIKIQT